MHGMRMVVGRRAGESSRCEDPAPTVGIAERMLRGIASGLYKASAMAGHKRRGVLRRLCDSCRIFIWRRGRGFAVRRGVRL